MAEPSNFTAIKESLLFSCKLFYKCELVGLFVFEIAIKIYNDVTLYYRQKRVMTKIVAFIWTQTFRSTLRNFKAILFMTICE